jgi:hypothetical protein
MCIWGIGLNKEFKRSHLVKKIKMSSEEKKVGGGVKRKRARSERDRARDRRYNNSEAGRAKRREYYEAHKEVREPEEKKEVCPPLEELTKDETLGATFRKAFGGIKERWSLLFFTINSNRLWIDTLVPFRRKFREVMVQLFDKEGIAFYLRDTTVAAEEEDMLQNVTELQSEWRSEVGKKKGFLHAHALVQVEHKGNMRVDLAGLRAMLREQLGHGCYLNMQSGSDQLAAWRAYLRKDDAPIGEASEKQQRKALAMC